MGQQLGLEFSELVQAMLNERNAITSLSYEQEQSIAADTLLLLITVCVINGFTYEALFEQYQLDSNEVMRKLAMPYRLKIIDLQPGNRIKLLIAPYLTLARWQTAPSSSSSSVLLKRNFSVFALTRPPKNWWS